MSQTLTLDTLLAAARKASRALAGADPRELTQRALPEERPALVNAWTALGGCYIQLGRPQDADALWRQLLAIDPGLPLIHKVLGQLAWMQGDLEQAEAFHRRSLELDPDQYETRLALARLLRRRNRPDEAAAMLRKLLEEDSNRNDVVLELGQALLEADAYEEALPHWQRLAALAPRNERYLSAVADIHLRANRQTSAVEAAQAVLQQNDRHIAALTLMADAHEFGESPADALPYLKRLCEIDDVPDLHDLTGTAFAARYEAAEAAAERGEIRLFRRLRAVDLWRRLLTMLFETGHPWITFKDPCNIRSPQGHAGVVHSSNLCTEITLNTGPNTSSWAICELLSTLPKTVGSI